ncbi:hypothetical protein LF1_14440 [Rubripirellula obstinata]|uniref:Uncharacterized protein n=1 Tax=Rubripirellula obstinata TaxID=406547 RepID=A0A5B1CH71_9BACT|nr:hypothetical protein LF1_14440 [Rubripirellula obstinata]
MNADFHLRCRAQGQNSTAKTQQPMLAHCRSACSGSLAAGSVFISFQTRRMGSAGRKSIRRLGLLISSQPVLAIFAGRCWWGVGKESEEAPFVQAVMDPMEVGRREPMDCALGEGGC